MLFKYLFLDIDGVLNNREILTRHSQLNKQGIFLSEERLSNMSFELGVEQVQKINAIVQRTKCKVILSSSWRACFPLKTMNAMLTTRGATFKLYDYTYSIYFNPEYRNTHKKLSEFPFYHRGYEIALWLWKESFLTSFDKVGFAIIDDDRDMEFLEGHLVKTEFEKGILDSDVDKVCELLETEIGNDVQDKIQEFMMMISENKGCLKIENLREDNTVIYG